MEKIERTSVPASLQGARGGTALGSWSAEREASRIVVRGVLRPRPGAGAAALLLAGALLAAAALLLVRDPMRSLLLLLAGGAPAVLGLRRALLGSLEHETSVSAEGALRAEF